MLFDREIVRILDSHCVMCHAQGGVSFPLETYEQTWLRRQAIYDQVLARRMPPWPAVPGYGRFSNANTLTLREQRFIVSWVEGLGPRNDGIVFLNVPDPDPASREEVAANPEFGAWALGEPDLAVALPVTGTVARDDGRQTARIRRIVIDPDLGSETWLDGLEYRPADRGATRAAVFTFEDTGQWLASWTPWRGFRRLPDNSAYRLPAGARIAAELHTTAEDDADTAPGELGLHFRTEPAAQAISEIVLAGSDVDPSGDTRHRIHAETRLADDATVLAVWPVLPPDTLTVELTARQPDGKVEVLLYAREIPLDWPTPYIFETPVVLPRDTRLSLTAYLSGAAPDSRRTTVELRLSTVDGSVPSPP